MHIVAKTTVIRLTKFASYQISQAESEFEVEMCEQDDITLIQSEIR